MAQQRRERHSERVPAAEAIGPVVAKMEAIAAALDENDGVSRFNELSLAVTVEIAKQTADDTFEDPGFISRLDVIFADIYFAAVADDAAGRAPSKAWAPLFAERHKDGVSPLQFAIAGMNAHINHDLALALVATCDELAIGLDKNTPHTATTWPSTTSSSESRTRSRSASRAGSSRRSMRLSEPPTTCSQAGA